MGTFDIHTHLGPLLGNESACPQRDSRQECLVSLSPAEYESYKGGCCSVGIHPWCVLPDNRVMLDRLSYIAHDDRVRAIGECGLDTLKGLADFNTQREVFISQIELSELVRKPMVLHVVRQYDAVLSLRKSMKPQQDWMVHGFRGGAIQAMQLMEKGLLISVGMNSRDDAVAAIPDEKLFVETDGKFTMDETVKRIAAVRNVPEHYVETIVLRNASLFLGLDLQS